METYHLAVTRRARYHTLGRLGPTTRQIWFVCHGYSQLASPFLEYCRILDDGTRFVVAPEALSRFYVQGTHGSIGASWMTKEDRDHEIEDYVGYLDALYTRVMADLEGRADPTVHALGFSQGVATVCRWAARGAASIDHLILWGERLPPEFDTPAAVAPFGDTRVTVVVGERDEYVTEGVVAAHHERLTDLGLVFETFTFDGGHRLDKKTLAAIATPISRRDAATG